MVSMKDSRYHPLQKHRFLPLQHRQHHDALAVALVAWLDDVRSKVRQCETWEVVKSVLLELSNVSLDDHNKSAAGSSTSNQKAEKDGKQNDLISSTPTLYDIMQHVDSVHEYCRELGDGMHRLLPHSATASDVKASSNIQPTEKLCLDVSPSWWCVSRVPPNVDAGDSTNTKTTQQASPYYLLMERTMNTLSCSLRHLDTIREQVDALTSSLCFHPYPPINDPANPATAACMGVDRFANTTLGSASAIAATTHHPVGHELTRQCMHVPRVNLLSETVLHSLAPPAKAHHNAGGDVTPQRSGPARIHSKFELTKGRWSRTRRAVDPQTSMYDTAHPNGLATMRGKPPSHSSSQRSYDGTFTKVGRIRPSSAFLVRASSKSSGRVRTLVDHEGHVDHPISDEGLTQRRMLVRSTIIDKLPVYEDHSSSLVMLMK